ncbi:MAG: heme biosynthesis protein HemY [Betaproteobacteria bacterium]|nr:heme biosynthesis protein HemY [Betaproteobacteria bacterium]
MRGLFWLIAVFAAAVSLALAGRVSDGYVLVVYPPWRIEISLLLSVLALVVAFGVAYLAVRLISHTLALPAQVRAFRERRKDAHAQSALAAALQCHFEGRYARAEKEAGLAWEAGVAPGIAALIAARAAHQMHEAERRDQWLKRAEGVGESLRAARLLTQAELALDEHDFIGARDALRNMHGSGPRNIATARMQLRAERGAQNWQEVLRLSSLLAKRGALPAAVTDEHRVQAHLELLARDSGERATLEARLRRMLWSDLAQPRVAAAAATRAAALGAAALARELIERSLGVEWNATLVGQYGDLEKLDGEKRQHEARARLERAERWLREHAEDPQLLATLGRLCVAVELWGKAQNYLEASLSFGASRAAHLELARLAEREGRAAEAQKHFRHAGELP